MTQDTSPVTPLEPAILVIFGITGDLAQRKLFPALYHLYKDKLIDQRTEIIGLSRRDISVDELLTKIEVCVLETDNVCDPDTLALFKSRLRMLRFDPVNADDYATLHSTLDDIETKQGQCLNRLYYLAIPPQIYGPVIKNLGEQGLQTGCQHHTAVSRLLVEKPFGYDLASAQELIDETSRYFHEDQIFRIDHYLAKESAQNIVTFRQQNPMFAGIWNRESVRHIEIVASEKIGVEGRASFYDNVGALRDVVQSHLLQLLALVTMELPASGGTDSTLHRAKQHLLDSILPVDMQAADVVRAQYDGYRDEVQNPTSTTETYVGLSLTIDNDRWRGVPLRLTTGKALENKRTAICLTFAAPHGDASNRLTFRIQPNEGVDIELAVKRPGFDDKTEMVKMDFSYHGVFNEPTHPDAYERVLADAIRGDRSLFATSGEVLASWRILQPVLDAWSMLEGAALPTYAPGSEGPEQND